ncbi:Methionyl-tRNA formyltransferase [hydrothermal vent metagenome]|uniref:methionyl-tRNA formyltransferase n=1 Tax=hydrothermal vent metagenome TaxID=652676 RepID=A0A3B0UI67_9ZZZZ
MKRKEDLRIVFMGTPDFAVSSLKALLDADYNVVAVITAPDKPAGRGKKISQPAVKRFAVEQGLKVLQPPRLKNPEFLEELESLKADLQVVVAFRMLPRQVWDMPPMGTINLHASLLPQYRGAAPIHHAIINGEKETGLTTFLLQKEIDTGNILFRKRLEIGPEETVGELHDRMMVAGGKLLVETIEKLCSGEVTPVDQKELIPSGTVLKPAPKIFKEDCRIRWNNDLDTVHNFIRGLSPYPGAFSELNSPDGEAVIVKIYKASREKSLQQFHPGTIFTDGRTYIKVAVVDGFILLHELQLAGKKRLRAVELLRGFSIDDSWYFV